MIKNFTDFLKFIWNNLLSILLIILFIVVSCYLLTKTQIVNPEQFENQEILFFGITLSNWSTWLTYLALIVTAIWSIYQYHKTVLRKQQEKASEIAKQFSDNLLLKCEIINTIYKHSPLKDILGLDDLRYDLFSNFNLRELQKIYNKPNFESIYKELDSKIDFDNAYYFILEKRISITEPLNKKKENSNETNKKEVKHYTTKEAQKLFILNNSNLPFHFKTLVDDVLNDLEQVCMNISSQAAGTNYIYQSLHQVFLRTVRTLAVEISLRNNKSHCEKYYTNVIDVYNQWTKLYEKNMNIEKRKKHKANKYVDKIDKILSPKIRTV